MDGHRGKMVYAFPPRESPFATENTKVEPPPPVKGQRGSQVSFGGPEMITPAEIYYNQVAAVQKHQKAYFANKSNIELTDEVQKRKPPMARNDPNRPRAAQSSIALTDSLPAGAGQLPPAGFFYNANGMLQELPAHAAYAARSQIAQVVPGFEKNLPPSSALQKDNPPPAEYVPRGRAKVAANSAQRTLVDAIVNGRQHGSTSAANAALERYAPAPEGKKQYMVGDGQKALKNALSWEEPIEEEPPQYGYGGGGGGAGYQYNPPYDAYFPPQQHQQQFQPLPVQPPPQQPMVDYTSQYAQQGMMQYPPPPPPQPMPPPQTISQNPPPRYPQAYPPVIPGMGRPRPDLPPPPQPQPPSFAQAQAYSGDAGAGQLMYDQERRQWVTRDGQPARYDPMLKGGQAIAQAPSAQMPPRFQPQSQKPNAGGMRHPKLWLTSNQAEFGGPAPISMVPPPPEGVERANYARHGGFSREFAPPRAGGGFNM